MVNLVAKIPIKDLSSDEIFKFKYKPEQDGKGYNLQQQIEYAQLENNYTNMMEIKQPQVNDARPEEDFKDFFNLKYEYSFRHPLFMQKNSEKTKFDGSNYVFFNNMPFLGTARNVRSDNLELRH